MYKRDKAIRDITDELEMEDIIRRSKICHVAMTDGMEPYVLAFNFGYTEKTIWLHCALEGKKIDILKKNSRVCVEFNTDNDLFFRHEKVACSWRMRYRSVLISGNAQFVDDPEEKIKGLRVFMAHYSDHGFDFSAPAVNNVVVIKIIADKMTGRKFEYL